MIRIKYKQDMLLRVPIGYEGGCDGCYFYNEYVPGDCARPFDHMRALKCTETHNGEWIENENEPDGGYYEEYEELFIWERQKDLSKQTRTI